MGDNVPHTMTVWHGQSRMQRQQRQCTESCRNECLRDDAIATHWLHRTQCQRPIYPKKVWNRRRHLSLPLEYCWPSLRSMPTKKSNKLIDNRFNGMIGSTYNTSGWTEIDVFDGDDGVRIVIQITQKLFQEPEATDATFHATFCTLWATIITLLQSIKKKDKIQLISDSTECLSSHSLCIQKHQNQSWHLQQCNE